MVADPFVGESIGPAVECEPAEIIRSVLEPSHRMATGYQSLVVATRDGKVTTGVVRSETESTLELADGEARIVKISKAEIEARRTTNVSIMPEKLVENISEPEFADLVSFLSSLRQPQAASVSRERK